MSYDLVITPLSKLYYIVKESDIIILSLENVRMNPRKMDLTG